MTIIYYALAIAFGIILLSLVVVNIVDGVWRLASTIWVRRWLALLVTGLLAAIVQSGLHLAAPSLDFNTLAIATILTVPYPAAYITGRIAFLSDNEKTRQLGFAIRRELAERYTDGFEPSSSFWLDYVFDAEFGRRRERYQPPPL